MVVEYYNPETGEWERDDTTPEHTGTPWTYATVETTPLNGAVVTLHEKGDQ